MSSNVKFVLTIIVGSILFREPLKIEQMLSIVGVIVGLFMYSYYKINEKKFTRQVHSASKTLTLNSKADSNELQPMMIRMDKLNIFYEKGGVLSGDNNMSNTSNVKT